MCGNGAMIGTEHTQAKQRPTQSVLQKELNASYEAVRGTTRRIRVA